MKKLILLLIPLLISTLFSDWSKIGNREYLSLPDKIEHYSISSDEKMLLWIDTSGYFYKYDLVSGSEISKIKIPNNTNSQYYKRNWAFISSDNLSYIYSKVERPDASIFKFSYYIYRISDNSLIDSVIHSYDTKSSSYYQYHSENKFADYYIDINKLIVFTNIMESSDAPNIGSSNFGLGYIFQKNNGNWESISLGLSSTNTFFKNGNSNLWFKNSYYSYSYRMKPAGNYVSSYSASSSLINIYNNSSESFYKFSAENYLYGYTFNSGFFLQDKNLVLSTGTQFYNFNQDSLEKPQVFNKDERDLLQDFKIDKSKTANEFFSFAGNIINLYADDFKLESINKLNEISTISSIYHLSTTDELLIFDDNKQIIKISKDNLFKGIADFSLPKYKFMTDDTLNFTNHTYGDNLELYWDFGDSTYSNEKNPQKIYSKVGTYNVKLIAKWGTNLSELIKQVIIYPRFKADFEYTITGSFPKYIHFKNTSTGIISSYTWFFETDSLKNKPDTIREYFITGDYQIKLVAYSNGISSTKEVTIHLDFDKIPIDTNIVKKEYFFNNIGSEALKGFYEGNDRIIYLISSDSIKQIGLLNNENNNWNKNIDNNAYSLLRRENGVFTFLDSNRIVNIDLNGTENDYYKVTKNDNSIFINSYKNGLKIISYTLNFCYIYDFDEDNNYLSSTYHQYYFQFPGTITSSTEFDCQFLAKDNIFDFYYSFNYEGTYNNAKFGDNLVVLNEYNYLNFPIHLNKIERLNDSLLFTCHTDSILRFNIPPVQKIDSLKKIYPSKYKSHIVFKHKDFKFSYYFFLNDSLIVLSGNKNGKPAFLIINKDLELIKEYVIDVREGSFNFISQATNNRLLFSGFCYKEFGIKQPYFALIEDALFPLSDRIIDTIPKIDTIPQDTVITKIDTISIYNYPNPAFEKLNINIGSSKPATYNLKIYNAQGILEFETKNQTYNNSSKIIELNLDRFATGMFYYVIEINGITKTSKFIHLRVE